MPNNATVAAHALLLDALPSATSVPTGIELADGRRVFLEVKSLRQARVDELIGRLATAALQLRSQGHGDAIPVAMVHVPKFGRRAVQGVREFMQQYAPEVGWGMIDDRGGYVLVIPGLEVDQTRSSGRAPSPVRQTPRRLFADLQRWLLKILLLSNSPPANFPAAPRGRPLNPSEWSKLARVSQQTAYALATELEKRQLLVQGEDGLHLVDPRRLLDEWLHEDALYPAPRVWVRDALRGRPLDEIFAGAPVALGGFEAASRLGLLHVSGVGPPEIHVPGRLEPMLAERGLVQVEQRDAHFALLRSPYGESVFRGAQPPADTAIVDILQVALDVVASRARGREQADYLLERILDWQ